MNAKNTKTKKPIKKASANAIKPKTTTKVVSAPAAILAKKAVKKPQARKVTASFPTAAPMVPTEAPSVQTTSQLKRKLETLGVPATLAEAPKVFVAVLSKENSPKTFSEIFTVQSHGVGSCHSVLAKLASALTGQKITKAEHGPSGLEFFLNREFDVLNKESTTIPGSHVTYNGTTLGESVQIQIFKNQPHVLDSDPATLQTNKEIAKEAIQAAIKQNTFFQASVSNVLAEQKAKEADLKEMIRDL